MQGEREKWKATAADLAEQLAALQVQYEQVLAQKNHLLNQMFGRRSEKRDPNQLELLPGLGETDAGPAEPSCQTRIAPPAPNRKRVADKYDRSKQRRRVGRPPVRENARDAFTECLKSKFCLSLDRDSTYTRGFRGILQSSGIEVLRLPPRSPNLNAYAERFVRSIRQGCLDRVIFISERQLRMVVDESTEHYHVERNHQGLGNKLISEVPQPRDSMDEVVCMPRLGGILSHFTRAA